MNDIGKFVVSGRKHFLKLKKYLETITQKFNFPEALTTNSSKIFIQSEK